MAGAQVLLGEDNSDLARATVTAEVDGVVTEQASGSAVMGAGGLISIVWFANKLAEFDLRLRAECM